MSELRSKSSAPIRHFTDLIIWQRAHGLALDIFRLTKAWPPDERFALTDQIRRSSRAVGANIAEAWAKRRYEAACVAKLVDADGEAHETEHWLINAEGCGYITTEYAALLRSQLSEIGRMLGSMINRPTPFVARRNDTASTKLSHRSSAASDL